MLPIFVAASLTFSSVIDPFVCPDISPDPPIPGVLQGGTDGPKARVLLGISPNYPPYAMWTDTQPRDLGGYVVELGALMEPVCNIKVDFTLVPWSDCWTTKPSTLENYEDLSEYVGPGIQQGQIHGCSSYTHAKGERGLSLEFTDAILGDFKRAGILTRLDDTGKPMVSPTRVDYTGVKLADVTGWAPTADTFVFNKNFCVEGAPQFTTSDPVITDLPNGNEAAINALLDGTVDALYIYADQIYNFVNEGHALAEGFGSTYAYIQTGLNEWSYNGTTFAISKRGSGLASVLDPCIAKVTRTPEYMEVCKKYFSETSCIGGTNEVLFYDQPMNERTDSFTCKDGYCVCSEIPSSDA